MGILYWYIVQLVSKTLSLSSLLYRYSIYSINSTLTIVHTPLASFMADVTFGRFKTLLLLHVSFLLHVGILLGGILLTYTVSDFNNYFYAMLSVSLIALLTLSAHAREGYSSAFSVCLSVCLSVRITSGNLRRFSP